MTKLYLKNDPRVDAEEIQQYFYHSDHLGSASLISDYKGDEYQRIEYTPYGETWIERTDNKGVDYLPYRFTGKELDEETGLYYYGARYLDPKYSRWISCDPALSYYVEGKSNGTSGGIYNSINFNLYHYAGNNPIRYIDPTGMEEDDYYKSDWIKGIPDQYRKDAQKHVDNQNARHKENIKYMAQTIYGESRGENKATKTAIAWSIRNRADKKAETIKNIVTKRAQYSCWNKNDPNYEATTNPEEYAKNNGETDIWQECLSIAKSVLESKKDEDPTNGATHYYDKSMDNNPPIWTKKEIEPNRERVEVKDAPNIRFFKGVRF